MTDENEAGDRPSGAQLYLEALTREAARRLLEPTPKARRALAELFGDEGGSLLDLWTTSERRELAGELRRREDAALTGAAETLTPKQRGRIHDGLSIAIGVDCPRGRSVDALEAALFHIERVTRGERILRSIESYRQSIRKIEEEQGPLSDEPGFGPVPYARVLVGGAPGATVIAGQDWQSSMLSIDLDTPEKLDLFMRLVMLQIEAHDDKASGPVEVDLSVKGDSR